MTKTIEKTWDERSQELITSTLERIIELWDAWETLHKGDAPSVDIDGTCYTDGDDIIELATFDALSVEVRGGWYAPGAPTEADPEEFRILLSTGGPASQITGEIGQHGPENSIVSVQDWFKPWTKGWLPVTHDDKTNEQAAIAWFVSCFWLGE